ncbi:hypothetical protein EC957_010378 [Mortierella hygrophila]|uniref:Uncharacterized protein n=1 Tax=Mortierella hygrophila TaxID=979708 RepID=A0A9P6K4J2_9FUNG|nr:hypothetical protein EC957_010378 [Mortierella hygrophila]
MDFFAQSYSEEPQSDTQLMDSSKYSTHCTGQGYGCESNSHLRRASSGLEADLGQKHFHGFRLSHHPAQDYNAVGSPLIKNSHQGNERHNVSFNTRASVVSHEANAVDVGCTSPTSPPLHNRTLVSNPCLLHHTNTNGSGSVRPPTMPRTMSSPHTDHGFAHPENQASKQDHSQFGHGRSFSAVHQPTTAENPSA